MCSWKFFIKTNHESISNLYIYEGCKVSFLFLWSIRIYFLLYSSPHVLNEKKDNHDLGRMHLTEVIVVIVEAWMRIHYFAMQDLKVLMLDVNHSYAIFVMEFCNFKHNRSCTTNSHSFHDARHDIEVSMLVYHSYYVMFKTLYHTVLVMSSSHNHALTSWL